MNKKLTWADIHRKRRGVLKAWLYSLCEQSKHGKEAYNFPQALDIIDAIECCPADRLRGG